MKVRADRQRLLAREESGQDLLEYALLVALIAIFCVGAISVAGGSVEDVFNTIA